jgi:hypothetical protein
MKMKRMFHISSIGNRDSIRKNGLEPRSYNGRSIKYGKRIFLFSDIKNPPFDLVSHNDVDIWEARIPSSVKLHKDCVADKERGVEGCFYITEKISPENLKIERTVTW